MVNSLFEYLDSVHCNFFTKDDITFDLTEIERKPKYFVDIKFCCVSNVAIKNVEIARKNITFSHLFKNIIAIFPKNTDFFEKIT